MCESLTYLPAIPATAKPALGWFPATGHNDAMADTDPLDLSGRVAIVTGGGTGIGAATARLLAEHGADLVIASRTEAELEQVATSIRDATGRRCLVVRTDVKQETDIVRMVERTMEEYGQIDILVNNAGGTPARVRSRSCPPAAGTASSSSTSAVRSSAPGEVGRHMIERGSGAIVNVSSGAGVNGVKGGAHYDRGEVGPADVHTRHGRRVGTARHPLQLRRRSGWSVRSARSRRGRSPSWTTSGSRPTSRWGARAHRWRWRGRSCSSPATRRRT